MKRLLEGKERLKGVCALLVTVLVIFTLSACGGSQAAPADNKTTDLEEIADVVDEVLENEQEEIADSANEDLGNDDLTEGEILEESVPIQENSSDDAVYEDVETENSDTVENIEQAADDGENVENPADDSQPTGSTPFPISIFLPSRLPTSPFDFSNTLPQNVSSHDFSDYDNDSSSEPESDPGMANLIINSPVLDDSFATDGLFHIGLMPTDSDGNIITSGLTISAHVISPVGYTISPVSMTMQGAIENPKGDPLAVGMDFESSAMMLKYDPNKERAVAGELFIDSFLSGTPENIIATFDFGAGHGAGPLVPTGVSLPAMSKTRLLWYLSHNSADLKKSLSQLTEVYYHALMHDSLVDVMDYMNQFTSSYYGNYKNVIVVLSNGHVDNCCHLGDYSLESVISSAKALSIPICTIGLGPASELSPDSNSQAVYAMKSLAKETGCTYLAAADAGELKDIFQGLSQSLVKSQPVVTFNINPVPPLGTVVKGIIKVTDIDGNTLTSKFILDSQSSGQSSDSGC